MLDDPTAYDNYRVLRETLLTSLETSRFLKAHGLTEEVALIEASQFAVLFNFDLSQLLRAIDRSSGTWGASLYSRFLLLTMHECARTLASLLGKPMRGRLAEWGISGEFGAELSALHNDLAKLTATRSNDSRVARNAAGHRSPDAAVQLERLSEVVVKDIYNRGFQLLAWTTRFHAFCSAVVVARQRQLGTEANTDPIAGLARSIKALRFLQDNRPTRELVEFVLRLTGPRSILNVSPVVASATGEARRHATAKSFVALGAIMQFRTSFEQAGRKNFAALANVAQFTILFVLDLSELLLNLVAAETEWGRVAIARYLATALYQFGESFPDLFGEKVQAHISEVTSDEEVRTRFRTLKRRMDLVINEHQSLFAKIRHSVVAHRVPDATEQLQVMASIRVDQLSSLAHAYVSWCRELHDALTDLFNRSDLLKATVSTEH